MKEINSKTEIHLDNRNAELEKTNETLRKEITKRRYRERELKNSYKQLRALTKHLESVREEERAKISREVHDELGQSLTGLKIDLALLKAQINEKLDKALAEPLNDLIKKMSVLIDSNIQSVRRIAMELRPGVLDDLGTVGAIEWQAQDFEKLTGIKCVFVSEVENMELEREYATAVFRIFQETLTNVAHHSEATKVKVKLKRYRNKFKLEVSDNGIGISDVDVTAPQSLGLLGIRERALLFGGTVVIVGKNGKGTKVSIFIPRRRKAND
jgi:signal transduction histidine kinase